MIAGKAASPHADAVPTQELFGFQAVPARAAAFLFLVVFLLLRADDATGTTRPKIWAATSRWQQRR
jgi:hypothetical protein